MKTFLQTDERWSGVILRMTLGIVMFPHGAGKALGWFGGHGFAGTMGSFTTQMSLPAVLAFLVILAEFGGSLGLVVGLLTRVAAFGIACVMTGAIVLVHWHNGFFMNWFGQPQGEGFEYHLLAIGISLALMIAGGGKWSLDGALAQRKSLEA